MVGHQSRGQLVLIAAIVVATAILGSVVLLNTIHSSPDVSAQTDTKSLSETERMTADLETGLHELFLSTHSVDAVGERLPYVESAEFESAVDNYAAQYNSLVAVDQPVVVSVSYEESEAVDGAVAYDGGVTPPEGVLLEGADGAVPLLSMNATGVDGGVSIGFNDTDTGETDRYLNLTSDEVTYPDDGTPICEFDEDVSITLRNGTGKIVTDETFCGGVTVEYPGFDEVRLRNPDEPDRLTYTVSAAGATCGPQGDCVEGDIDISPTFWIELSDPSVSYETTITPYGVSDG